ncbi:MAG: SIMPL domain-containing protein [Actinomycetota bacterium]|nr:SIMPL domain-containing protein [Actinomycetota bacterium]
MAPKSDNTISVSGTGRVDVAPDVLLVSLALEGSGADVAGALDAASASTMAVLDALRAAAVEPADVGTSHLCVNQRYSDHGRITGYECRQALQLVLRDLDTSGRVLREVATAAGSALRVDDVSRSVSDPAPAAALARAAAFGDALAKAEQLAELAGRRLGAILNIEEAGGGGGPRADRLSLGPVARAASADVPIEQGSERIEATLVVRWNLVG